jgi:hypothetical protein
MRRLLLGISPATADRLLKRARQGVRPHGLGTTKPGSLLLQAIPIRTFAQWDDALPGFMEVDLVAHCGTSTHGEYLNSLDMVDVKTRWVELAALTNRSQATVTAAVTRLPGPPALPALRLGLRQRLGVHQQRPQAPLREGGHHLHALSTLQEKRPGLRRAEELDRRAAGGRL